MQTATCTTTTCSRYGVAVDVDIPLAEGEQVYCGTCARPTSLAGDPVPAPEPYPSPW